MRSAQSSVRAQHVYSIDVQRGPLWPYVTIEFEKDLYFLSKPQLKEALGALQPGDEVTIDGSKAPFIDHAMRNMLYDYWETANVQGIHYKLRNVVLNCKPE
ncbi:hypothetical protein [Spirosoma agri]